MRYLLLRITALAVLTVTFSLPCRAEETGAQSLDSSWIKAMRANDLEAVLKTYAPDAVVWLPQMKEARGENAIRGIHRAKRLDGLAGRDPGTLRATDGQAGRGDRRRRGRRPPPDERLPRGL